MGENVVKKVVFRMEYRNHSEHDYSPEKKQLLRNNIRSN